ETRRDLIEERGVEIDLPVSWTVERSHGALRFSAATGVRCAAIKNEHGRPVNLAVAREDLLPLQLGAAEHLAHEAAHLILGSAGGGGGGGGGGGRARGAGGAGRGSGPRGGAGGEGSGGPSKGGGAPRPRGCSAPHRRSECRNHRRRNLPRVDLRRCRFPADRPSAWFCLLAPRPVTRPPQRLTFVYHRADHAPSRI